MKRSYGYTPYVVILCLLAALVPTALQADELVLNWVDNSKNEYGFIIERSQNHGPYEPLATVPRNTTSYYDGNLVNGNTYQYRIRAYNNRGYSPYTNVAAFHLPVVETFEEWLARVMSSNLFSTASRSPDEVLGESGLPVLLCYAYGINPFEPKHEYLPSGKIVRQNGRSFLQVKQAVSKFSLGIKSRLLISNDLENWEPFEADAEPLSETIIHRWEAVNIPLDGKPVFWKFEITLDPVGL